MPLEPPGKPHLSETTSINILVNFLVVVCVRERELKNGERQRDGRIDRVRERNEGERDRHSKTGILFVYRVLKG